MAEAPVPDRPNIHKPTRPGAKRSLGLHGPRR